MKRIIAGILITLMICMYVPGYAQESFSFTNVYEDFESYADPTASGFEYVQMNTLNPLNGGSGWNGSWYDDSSTGTVTHKNHRIQKNSVDTSLDLYSYSLNKALYRKFLSPIDFSKAAEYYVRIIAQPSLGKSSGAFESHNMTFSIGKDISFGSKYVAGSSVKTDHPYYFPHLTVGSSAKVGSTNVVDGVETAGIMTASYYEYFLKIVADGKGNVQASFTLDEDIILSAEASGISAASYFKISDNSGATTRVSSIQIEGYSADSLADVREKFNGGTASEVLKAIEGFGDITKEILYNEYLEISGINDGNIIYEDFESYEDATDVTKFPSTTSGVALQTLHPLNGGVGWDGPWYDTDGKTITETRHQLARKADYSAFLDLYSQKLGSYPLKRDFKMPIDFSQKGEYYVKINAMASMLKTSGSFDDHNMTFSLGDKISFGTKYVAGSSDPASDSKHFYPHFKAGSTNFTGDKAYPTATYHTYALNIVSNGDGTGKARFKIYTTGTEAPGSYVSEADLSGFTTLDYIKISDTDWATARVSDIQIEYYEYDEINPANIAIASFSKGQLSYDEALAEISKVTGVALEHLLAELKYHHVYIEVSDGEFTSSDGVKLVDTSMITDSLLYNFRLNSNYQEAKDVDVILGIYYSGQLAGTKTMSLTVPGKTTTDTYTLGFDEKLPDGDKSNISVKVFIWESDTMMPFTETINMYSQSDRTVTPELFGADTSEPVTVAFIGDSITHLNPSYTKWIEYYYRVKFPNKKIRFVSKGISGDTCYGVENRFSWDILNDPYTGKPTEACLMIGMNDVGRSLYPDSGTEAEKQKKIDDCLGNIEDVAELCEANNIKLTLITPPLYDEADYSTAVCNTGVNAALGKIAAGVIKFANEKSLAYIDFYGYINSFNTKLRSMDEFKNAAIFNVNDRIHATKQGTFAEGFIFLIQQINNPVIASVNIDAENLTAVMENAEAEGITYTDGTLSYTYKPESLPMGVTAEYKIIEEEYGIPVTDSINREVIKITGLEEGNYKIMFDNTELGIYTASELEKGINIATLEVNPGHVQSLEVYDLVSAKLALDYKMRDIAFVERWLYTAGIDLTDVDACVKYVNETVKADQSKYSSNKTRIDNYESYKKSQADFADDIADYEAQAMYKAIPQEYSVKIIKQ